MVWNNVRWADSTFVGVLPQTLDDVATEANGVLSGRSPLIVPGVWTWNLIESGSPVDGLDNGQSCTLVVTPGAYSITWPTSTIIGTWPSGFDAGANVVVLFKVGGVLCRFYSGVAA